ncbi:CPBP family intramembrane glutamic endopeptidase [Nocardia sp. AB354]|uniref:CPBP family intramembrane glutamic endopeptidase n=1 Tax=Nocardia sp. AB354 TaxID=3413283 RepID=UPI003C1D5DCB
MNIRSVARTLSASCIALMWSNLVLPRLGSGIRGRTVANAAFATGYAAVFDGRPEWLSRRGWAWGAAAFGAIGTAYGVGLAVPGIRDGMAEFAEREPEVSTAEWVGIHIPVGTVYSEELIFRGTLDRLFDDAGYVRTYGGAVVFGLWHIHPARSAGDSIPATVAFTAAGGLLFSWLRRRTGSATAPALVHLALNAGGALAPRVAVALRDRRIGRGVSHR